MNTEQNTGSILQNGNWDAQSKQLKAMFPTLTDTDLKLETGKEDELLRGLETKLGKTREELTGILAKTDTDEAGNQEPTEPQKA